MLTKLKNYKYIHDEIQHIKDEIEILRTRAMSPRIPIITDMPRGGSVEGDAMANLIIKLEELEGKYNKLLNDLITEQTELEDMIQSLEPLERDLIRYRYVDGLEWYKIEEKLNYSPRTVFRMHKKILKKMEKMAQQGI